MLPDRGVVHLHALQAIARGRGGELLSSAYVNDTTKLRFRCEAGHRWLQRPTAVKQGKWCATCAVDRRAALRKAKTFERLKSTVAERGGTILSDGYIHSQSPLRVRCGRGHEWESRPAVILRGGWCRGCAVESRWDPEGPLRRTIYRRVRALVERRGGALESPSFTGARVPMRVRCAAGHAWVAPYESLEKGAWCRRCKGNEVLASIRHFAELRGGACLTRKVIDTTSSVRMRCALGHTWTTIAGQVRRGTWCPGCRLPRLGDIKRMHRLAADRGGKCLSTRYVKSDGLLRWRCREGHAWEATAGSAIQGSWCRVCERGQGRSRARLSIDVMRAMAAERGGVCLSSTYDGIYDRLLWKCARKHVWMTVANNVRRGAWCPQCAHSGRGTLEGMRELAREHGGRCVSRSWDDHRQPLKFECSAGHRFVAGSRAVKSGVWCPRC